MKINWTTVGYVVALALWITLSAMLIHTTRNLKADLNMSIELIERLNDVLDQVEAERDSVAAELRVFERYIRPDSTLLHDAMIVAGVRNNDAENYTRWMITYGMRTGISPRVLLAVASVESAFNPRAVSSADAHGLMQLVPFWWWNVYRKECGAWNPYNARMNICYGAHVLRFYLDRHNGNYFSALSAYNSGYARSTAGHEYARDVLHVMETL